MFLFWTPTTSGCVPVCSDQYELVRVQLFCVRVLLPEAVLADVWFLWFKHVYCRTCALNAPMYSIWVKIFNTGTLPGRVYRILLEPTRCDIFPTSFWKRGTSIQWFPMAYTLLWTWACLLSFFCFAGSFGCLLICSCFWTRLRLCFLCCWQAACVIASSLWSLDLQKRVFWLIKTFFLSNKHVFD